MRRVTSFEVRMSKRTQIPTVSKAFSRAVHGQSCLQFMLKAARESLLPAQTVPKPPLRIAGRRFNVGRIKRQFQAPGERRNDRAGNRP